MIFRNRHEAGRQLAEQLRDLVPHGPVVLGLTRGGVPVAGEVARALHAPLDVLVVRKLGCPWHPELGVGAIGEQGARVVDHRLVAELRITDQALAAVEARERAELDRRVRAYRQGRPPVDLHGQTVIVVDDGIATGSTAKAAIEVARRRGADRVVLAVPVAPREAVRGLGALADVVCMHSSDAFWSVGQFYADFTQVTDDEVTDELARASSVPTAPDRAVDDPPPAVVTDRVRQQELADLRLVPLGNALFTRDSFEAAYGAPVLVKAPEHVDLRGREPGWRCIYCDGDRFTAEICATDHPEVHVEFWWCDRCQLGHAVRWGATDDRAPRPRPGRSSSVPAG